MLDALLTHQRLLLEQLMSALEQENQILAARDIDAINQIAQQKNVLLKQINENDLIIAEHPDRDKLKTTPVLIKQRQHLQALLVQCQQANTLNGHIIKASSDEIERLAHQMNQLLQKNSMTYDKAGRQHTASRHGKSFKA
ncbi:flagellar export chaperone FlgN [Celerinatantimonas yamalensis]|uniref:Flagellar protein FlgN n=1 Tax=Celerinatantimonas yamalensis TaxID=559956 RepID=A0ABW9G659_9GAMM